MSRAALLTLVCIIAPLCRAEDHPERTFEFGFEQRVRNENWNNIFDYGDGTDDQRNQIRYRTRVWFQAPITDNIEVFVGLNQETNQWLYPSRQNHFDEVLFENAYVNIKKLFVKGLSLKVGRQNLPKGEGFLLLDGTSGDGSRTIYFDAVNLAYSWKKSKVELIGIMNPKRDRMFPVFHDQQKILQDWDESAAGVYYTDNNHKNVGLEGYYFYKKETNDYLPPTNPQFQPDRHISTAGGRAVRRLPRGWSLTGEFAGQWGAQHGGADVHGWGGYGYAKKEWKTRWRPYALGGWWGFSGDDPATKGAIEGWDPLFSRWPKWSELYIYSQVREVGVAYWTNTGMWQAETGFSPHKMLAARLTWYHMNAFHPFPGAQSVFGDGTGRGENLQARLEFIPNKNWKAHVLYETQRAGDYYRAQAPGYFLRFEVSYAMTGKLTANEFKRALGFGGGATHTAEVR
ncbi:MAG: hypothetical protein ACM336_07350 [Acidobacteriota bacterium]